jgi:uncharacterized delta-60 repeat protein
MRLKPYRPMTRFIIRAKQFRVIMRRLGNRNIKRFPGWGGVLKMCFILLMGGTAGTLYAAPANDNFANAQTLTGDFGTVTADTTTAGVEAGEPNHAGLTPHNTVWYKWTASSDGPVEFDTFNSGFDTAIAVYVGSSLQNLSMVVANDDVNNYNPEYPRGFGGDAYAANPYLGPSGVKFNAKRGQLYYLAVGGTRKNNSAPFGGSAVLSWAYHPSGVFRLSHQFYYCSEAESDGPPSGTVSHSARGARITINRLFGSKGKAIVSFDLVDGTATVGVRYKRPDKMTVTFDNEETSKSSVSPIIDDAGILPPIAIRNPGRFGVPDPNGSITDFGIVLTNVVLDPLEDPTVLSPPRFESKRTSGTILVYDMDTPGGFQFDPFSPSLGITNGVVNFERSYFRVSEKVGVAHILVYRSFPFNPPPGFVLPSNFGGSTEIHYVIDSTWVPEHTDLNYFQVAAGSDYAHPILNSTDGPKDLNADFGNTTQLALDHVDWNITDTDGLAPADPQYGTGATYGTLRWDDGDFTPKEIWIPIIDDGLPEFNEDLEIELFQIAGHTQDAELGENFIANVTILFDDYPPGALDDTHNPDWNIATDPVNNPTPGTDNQVYSLAVHANDNKTVIGGNFGTYNAYPRDGLARINADGSLDQTFNPGDGVPVKDPINPSFISAVAYTPSDKIVVGGNFPSYNGTSRFNIAQINANGSLDSSFNPGLGANGTVWTIAVQTNGQVVIGGDFTSVDGYARPHIARLNANGSVDQSFDPGTNGPNGTVNAITISPDGSMFIGGDFTFVNGLARNSIAKITTNGVVIPAFSPVTGCDGPVFALALQTDGKLLVGGAFHNIEFRTRNNIARFNPDGSLDVGFEPGDGTDDAVYSINLNPDGRIYIAGVFNSYNQTRRNCIARLFTTGELDTGFMDTAYNQFAGPHKTYFNPYVDPKDFLLSVGLQSDGNLMIGGKFHYIGGGRFEGNVATNSYAPFDGVSFTRAAYRSRWNVTRLLGGDCDGPGSTSLIATNYSVVENMGFLYIKESRQNGNLGRIESTFSIPPRVGSNTVGIAQSGVDYVYNRVNPEWGTSWSGTREFGHGIFGTNNITTDPLGGSHVDGLDDINVTINNISGYQGDRLCPFKLDTPSYADIFYLGGENIPLGSALGPYTGALLKIQEDAVRPGVIGFSVSSFTVNENGGNAVVTITRTNGSTGTVLFRFATTNGTAVAGVDYIGVTNTITLRDGQTSTNVTIPILNDFIVQQADRTINLYLANPGNGATLGTLSNAVLYIIDDDFLPGRLNFTTTAYQTNETAPAMIIPVTRTGGNMATPAPGSSQSRFSTMD